MGGLVVGSAFPSYVGESEVGAAIVPTVGGLVRQRIDYTRLAHASTYRKDLLCWLPLQDLGARQREIAEFANANGGASLAWSGGANLAGVGPRGREVASGTDGASSLQLGGDIFALRPEAGTLSMWLRVVSPDAADLLLFLMGDDTADGVLFSMSADGRAQILYTVGGVITAWSASTSTTLADGRWHHVVWNGEGFTASGPWVIWIDGKEETLIDIVGPNLGYWFADVQVDTSNASLLDQSLLASAHGVLVADVASWSRKLTDTEIVGLYRDPDAPYARTRRATVLDRFRLHPGGISSAEAFGTAKLNQQIRPSAIASAEAFGTARLNQQIRGTGIAIAEAHGTARVNQQLRPTGIATAEALGTPSLAQQIRAVAIASAEAFGTPSLPQQVLAAAIASAEAHGTPSLIMQLRPLAIVSAEAFGSPSLAQQIRTMGIASAEAVGLATLLLQIGPVAIGSAEAFGLAALLQQIRPTGISSAEAFGLHQVGDIAVIDAAIAIFTGERRQVLTFTGERLSLRTMTAERLALHLLAGGRLVDVDLAGSRRSIVDLTGDKT